jgi:hypothetical protein
VRPLRIALTASLASSKKTTDVRYLPAPGQERIFVPLSQLPPWIGFKPARLRPFVVAL